MPDRVRLQSVRKQALREVRRRQRAADTLIERLERRIFALLERKTLIDEEDAVELYDRWFRPFMDAVKSLEQGLADFIDVSND